jgi:diguanylate cyclase (GGDEF)-like protein
VPNVAPLEILVVEDDPSTRAAVRAAVRSLGHECRSAADGSEACRMLAERPADVVISDWEMPRMTGAELCRRIREMEDGRYTYFILMSGFHDRGHLLEGMAAGADDYQKKPIDLDELEARLVSAARVVALHRRLAEREDNLRRDSTQLWAASRTDALTGVGNRLRMEEELAAASSRAHRYGHRFSLAIIDVDQFKPFNDGLGHVAGDEALKQVAKALRRAVRAGDGIYRYGGEEFVVLLPEQSLADARCAIERVREEVLKQGIARPEKGQRLTVSAGVAELDQRIDASVEDWIARADAALYVAKTNGRNRVETVPSDRGPMTA